MARTRLNVYVTPPLAEALRRVAALQNRSTSDIIQDVISRYFTTAHSEAEHHAVMAQFERTMERLGAIEKSQEIHFELTCHSTRFLMSFAPDIPDPDKSAFNARGRLRFRTVIGVIVKRLQTGRSAWKDHFAGSAQRPEKTIGNETSE